jgi:predicted DNA binding CopG/RHH family protein
MKDEKKLYRCPECLLHYTDEDTAVECEEWCSKNKSCNLEITEHSVEAQKSKASSDGA